MDERSERLQAKIRDAALQKIPYLAIIGKSEFESKSVSIRTREGKDLGKLELTKFIQKIKEEIDKKV